jgi:hypothetical protein
MPTAGQQDPRYAGRAGPAAIARNGRRLTAGAKPLSPVVLSGPRRRLPVMVPVGRQSRQHSF